MNLLYTLDFYVKNSLSLGGVDYSEKLHKLCYFADKPFNIDTITDYCSYRTLQGVKNATINRELTILRSAVNFYNKHHEKELKNPLNGFKLFEEDYIPRYLSSNECQKLLDGARLYQNPTFYHFVNLLLNTGCRYKEMIALRWDCVNLDKRYMTIRNTLSKNRKTVHKPLNHGAMQSLNALQNASDWVFYNPKTHKHYVNYHAALTTTLKRTDLGKVRFHDLRHTFASLLVEQGIPLYNVMQLLGHSTITTTQRYAHLSPNNLASVVNCLPHFE